MDEENDTRNLYHPVEKKYWKLGVTNENMSFKEDKLLVGL